MSIEAGQIYQHYKGDVYRVLHVANHTETKEKMVVYCRADGPVGLAPIWVRPLDMFMSLVTVKGRVMERFSLAQNNLSQQSLPLG